jgi:tetratricopeptide (TPR) repeat protein
MTRYGLVLVCAVWGVSQWAEAGPLDEARTLIQQGRYEQIYALGTQHPELLGSPEFDYYFGIAATDAGHAGEGLLALERFLIQYPENLQARAELARAYFLLGEDDRAREEFDAVLKANPGAAVQQTVERYLDLITTRQSRYQATSAFYAEGGIGWDSNTNGGVSNANINLPVFGNVVVLQSAVRKPDTFSALTAGGKLTRPLVPDWTIFGGFNIDAKSNRSHHETSLLSTNVAGGVEHEHDAETQMISFAEEVIAVGSDRFRSSDALNGEWQRRMGERQALQASANFARYDYAGDNAARDAQFAGLGLGYRRALVSPWQPLLQLGASYGRESNSKNRPDLGRNLAGLRIAVTLSPNANWSLALGLTYQDSRYSGVDTLLATRRRDAYRAADATATYSLSKTLSLRSELLLSDNDSNLSLNKYKRNVVAVKLRYDLK